MKRYMLILLALTLGVMCLTPAMAEEEIYNYTLVNWRAGPFPEERPIEKWAEEYFGITVDLIYIDQNDYWAQLNTRLAGGDIPDVFLINNSLSSGIDYYKQGLISNFTEELLRQYCPNVCAVVDKYAPQAWTLGLVADGKLISIPGIKLQYSVSRPLHYNKTWLDKLGKDVPVTLEEFEDVIYAFAKDDPDDNGVDDTYGFSDSTIPAIYGAFGTQPTYWIVNDDDTVSYGFARPGMREALELLAKWYADGVIDPEYITGENMGGYVYITHAFCYQKIGVSGLGTYAHWYPDIEYNGAALNPSSASSNTGFIRDLGEDSFDIVMAPNPRGPYGDAGSYTSDPITWRMVFSADLVADTARFTKLLTIIDEWYSNGETYSLCRYGKEGVWWTGSVNEAGDPIRVFKEGADMRMLDNPFDFIDPNPDLSYAGTINEKYDVTAQSAAIDAYVKEVVIPTLNTDYMTNYVSPFYVSLPSRDLLTDIRTMLSECITKIITGEEPITYYDKCLALFYEMGGDKLTQEANDIYSSLK